MDMLKLSVIIVIAIFGSISFYKKNAAPYKDKAKYSLIFIAFGGFLVVLDLFLIILWSGFSPISLYLTLYKGIADEGFGGRLIMIGYTFIFSGIFYQVIAKYSNKE